MKKLILAIMMMATPLAADVHVRDADTIVVDGTPVRFQGVDAPELKTRAGQDAKRWMVNFLRGQKVNCDLTGERSYDRYIGICYVKGQDIGAAVIAAGHALDCRRYSGGRYQHLEQPSAKSRIKRAGYCS
ncbi:thermonuclease family protein [Shimia sp. Alg240-R146]|uniref:thermonuclease family protein n=1 Tax=Shimia sp. Alg240-R146 TaxID=2993449 RepID=UPI0022E8D063|nr:thermonuclease family protein [Shimia sp. Alg240-R146]